MIFYLTKNIFQLTICMFVNKGQYLRPEWMAKQWEMPSSAPYLGKFAISKVVLRELSSLILIDDITSMLDGVSNCFAIQSGRKHWPLFTNMLIINCMEIWNRMAVLNIQLSCMRSCVNKRILVASEEVRVTRHINSI